MENILDYGADPTGTNDSTTAINNALAVGSVYAPTGTYLVNGALLIPSGRTVCGDGASTVFKQTEIASNWTRTFSVIGKQDVILRDVTVDGNGHSANMVSGEQRHNIWIEDSVRVTVRNVHSVAAQGDGCAVYSSATGSSEYVVIDRCYFTDRGRASVSVLGYGASNVVISGCVCRKGAIVAACTSQNVGGIHLEPQAQRDNYNIAIIGNTIEHGGIVLTCHEDGTWNDVEISGNHIRLFDRAGVALSCLRVRRGIVASNRLYGQQGVASSGMNFQDCGSGNATGSIIIRSNTIAQFGTNSTHNAIIVQPSQGNRVLGRYVIDGNIIESVTGRGINLVMTPDVVISNNIICNTGLTGIAGLNVDHYVITGNLLRNTGSTGMQFSTSNESYPVRALVITGNAVWFDDRTGKSSLMLGAGTIGRVLCDGNDFGDAINAANAMRIIGTMTDVDGRDQRLQPTGVLVDARY